MARDPREDDDQADPFAPPPIPIEVACLHCQEIYDSWQIEWRERDGGPSPDRRGRGEGDWCCPTPGCDGVGFCFDIWPTDPEWRDENGDRVVAFDDGEEGDEEIWLDDEEGEDDFDWVPTDPRPMTPEEQEALDRAWEELPGDLAGDEGLPRAERRGRYDEFDEDDIPF